MDNQVIIELTTNYPELMERLVKFHQAINHAFSEKLKSELFIEPFHEGMLYIFRDFDAFTAVHAPIPRFPEFIKKRLFQIPFDDEKEILGSVLKDQTKFPADGIKYYLKPKSNPVDRLFPILSKYYQSIHPQIMGTIENDAICLKFGSYEAVRRNFELMYWVVKKVLRSKGLSLHELYNE